jgi:signal transduction histidine kinase
LSIAKHLVELHGGSISASSGGSGQGSTFVVQIPIAPVTATGSGDAASQAASA